MSIYKTRKRIKGDDGQYHIVYQETSADQVKSKDGTSAEDHFSALLVSEDGVHGMRYNPAEEALEGYNPETEQYMLSGQIQMILLSVKLYYLSGLEHY